MEQRNTRRAVSTGELIERAAEEGARRALALRGQVRTANLYRATERLLRSYPRFRYWEEHPEEYGFFPAEKSKDISVAPPPGAGVRDRVEIWESYVAARQASFERTMGRYYDIKAVVDSFSDRPEFVVIRMYYFNETIDGRTREREEGRYSFGDIADELAVIGIERSETTLRSWRSQLVQDMTVMLFGLEGAVSVESHGPRARRAEDERSE